MSQREFMMPDLGEGLTEGEVVAWLVAVGDTVEVDQYIAEVETAKAVVEVPSPFAGTVTTLHAQPGEEVAVGEPLITIDVGGEGSSSGATGSAGESGSAGADGDLSSGDAPGTAISATGSAEAAAEAPSGDSGSGEDRSESGSVLVGYGTSGGGGSRRRRVTSSAGADSAHDGARSGANRHMEGSGPDRVESPAPVERDGRPKAKPPVRKLAKDLGVDLDVVAGSGEDGVITREDVHAAADTSSRAESPTVPAESPAEAAQARAATDPSAIAAEHAAAASAEAGARDTGSSTAGVAASADGSSETRIPMGQIRKAISAQMGRSRREIPEAVTWVEADATPLWKLRRKLNEASETKISPLALIMRMAVAGLRAYPSLNASLDVETEEIVQYGHVNLGIAAQTPRGLVVPVIPDAHIMTTVQLAAALNEKAETARAGKLTPTEMSGGTFTISNYGAFGVDGGDMVINHPEVAILGVGRITDKPWVTGGKIKVRKVITYSIAFDHRVCDGGEGAGFLRLLADMTEDPTQLVANL